MVALNNFCKSRKDRKRFGRSGCFGGTSGRGHKGYKARSGSTVKGFEGGQTPIYRRLPMRGFNSNKDSGYVVVSLKRIASVIKEDFGGVIDNDVLFENNIIKNVESNVKMIGTDLDIDLKRIKKIELACLSKSLESKFNDIGVEVVLKSN